MSISGPTQHGSHEEKWTHKYQKVINRAPPSFSSPSLPLLSAHLPFMANHSQIPKQFCGGLDWDFRECVKASLHPGGTQTSRMQETEMYHITRRGQDAEERKCGEGGTDRRVIGRCSKFPVLVIASQAFAAFPRGCLLRGIGCFI